MSLVLILTIGQDPARPTWLFMKAARMSGYPIDMFSGIRYYIDD